MKSAIGTLASKALRRRSRWVNGEAGFQITAQWFCSAIVCFINDRDTVKITINRHKFFRKMVGLWKAVVDQKLIYFLYGSVRFILHPDSQASFP